METMSSVRAKDPIAKASGLPAGAVFHRCALQVNPHGYGETFRGQQTSGDVREHAKAIVEQAVEVGISVLAITNHNDVSGVAAFREAAQHTSVTIFPGFELSSSEGIHILCIYPPDTDKNSLDRFLGEFRIRKTGPSANLSSGSFDEVLTMVEQQGGVAIAAHVTNAKGLFKALGGQARINAWRTKDLLAVQIPGPVDNLPSNVRPIIQNENPDYRRNHPADENLAVAAINAKDIVEPSDLKDSSATCWIKMSEITVEGLRQAFLDPGSRIRLNSDSTPDEHAELVSLTWEGGFLDGASIRFNPNMNVLVGGRGTGKSTIIESLRYALGLEPIGEEADKAHKGIVRQVLRNGTKVSLLVRCDRPAPREYRIERTVPNPPVVRDEYGKLSNLLPKEVLPRVEVYGQHEISELTKSPEKLTRLLDRFVKRDHSSARRKADLRRELEKTRRSLVEVCAELQQIEERLAALPRLEDILERFREVGLEDRLREKSLLVREERVLNSMPERLQNFRECLDLLRQELPIDRVFLSERALQDLPGKKILASGNDILESLSADLDTLADQFAEVLKQADEGIAEIRFRWNERQEKVQADYEKILRELQKSAIDGQEFIRLRREIENLRPLGERKFLLKRLEKDLLERRRRLLARWEEIKAEEFRNLDRAAQTVSKKLRYRVQVEVAAAGSRELLIRLLRDEIGGRLSEALAILAQKEDFSLPQFVDSCRTGADAVHRAYKIPPAQAQRLAEASAETLMLIEELELSPATTIHLNTAPSDKPPSWQALEALSTGQKATTVLLLLLLESDAPLIVDQPEDDLDNRFITEGVVPKMRDEKRRRQFVFSTHNANILVLGDAELIVGLTATGGGDEGNAYIDPKHIGSIDAHPVREMVEEILEGGKDAFERRRRKYGF